MSTVSSCGLRTAASQHQRPGSIRSPRCALLVAAQANTSSSGKRAAPQQPHAASRREALLSAAGLALLPAAPLLAPRPAAAWPWSGGGAAPPPEPAAPEGFKHFADSILAYEFDYPVATVSGAPLSLVLTRPPEKYSSAAPLSADARQRIVSELFDLRRFVTVSLTVGPASGVLKDAPQEQWRAKDVALTVLIDRSTARKTTGQRTALNDVEQSRVEERGGQKYYVYEHRAQGSATSFDRSPETFRHAVAATTVRPGLDGTPYLYTLNLSCPEGLWEDLSPRFLDSIESFRLLPTTNAYIPPDKDPWLFF